MNTNKKSFSIISEQPKLDKSKTAHRRISRICNSATKLSQSLNPPLKSDNNLESRRKSFFQDRNNSNRKNSNARKQSLRKNSVKLVSLKKDYIINNKFDSIVDSINKFTFDFYLQHVSHSNLVVSPISLYYVLHFFHSCSDPSTKTELEAIFNLSKDIMEKPFYEELKPLLTEQIRINNVLHSKENYLLDEYKQISKLDYNYCVYEKTINELKELTKNDLDIFMVLFNEIELEFEWQIPFEIVDNELMKIPEHEFLYAKNPLGFPFRICELPFKNDQRFVMTILMTTDVKKMKNLEGYLRDHSFFDTVIKEMRKTEINLLMTKYKIENEFGLAKLLVDLGAKSLINLKKDNQDMDSSGLNVDTAGFKTSIEISNTGLKAKIQTNFNLKRAPLCKAYDESNLLELAAKDNNDAIDSDNPYVFLIRSRENKLILFMGKLIFAD